MNINYWFTEEELENIKKLYASGMSSQEIKDELKLPHTVRSIQRRVKSMGIIRSVGDAYRLAAKKGRIHWVTKEGGPKHRLYLSPRTRFIVMERDGFKCQICGATKEDDRLEVDHINEDPTNNKLENLRVLCRSCNLGRSPREWTPTRGIKTEIL